MGVTTHKQRKAHPVPTEPGHYWVRLDDPKTLEDYPLVDNDRIVRIVRLKEGNLSVETRGLDGIIGRSPSDFPCHAWGASSHQTRLLGASP